MTTTLRSLLSELDRPDLEDTGKQIVQREIEKLLGRNAREILMELEILAGVRKILDE